MGWFFLGLLEHDLLGHHQGCGVVPFPNVESGGEVGQVRPKVHLGEAVAFAGGWSVAD